MSVVEMVYLPSYIPRLRVLRVFDKRSGSSGYRQRR